MRNGIWTVSLSVLVLLTAPAGAITLQQAYEDATPGAGYDKMVVLDAQEMYTGGLTIPSGSVYILSVGAQVDLQGSEISIQPEAELDISGVVLLNSGEYALKYEGIGSGWVDHCTFYGNQTAVYFFDRSSMKLTSNIFSNSSLYGVYTHDGSERWMAFNDAWANAGGSYRE